MRWYSERTEPFRLAAPYDPDGTKNRNGVDHRAGLPGACGKGRKAAWPGWLHDQYTAADRR